MSHSDRCFSLSRWAFLGFLITVFSFFIQRPIGLAPAQENAMSDDASAEQLSVEMLLLNRRLERLEEIARQ